MILVAKRVCKFYFKERLSIIFPLVKYLCLKDLSQEDLIESNPHVSTAHVKSIYVWMGRELESLDEAPAGTVIGL